MADEFVHQVIHVDEREIPRTTARQSESIDGRLDQLEATVKNLSLINEALYQILVDKLSVTDVDLAVMMDRVSVNRANRLEAKSPCNSCGRLVTSVRQKCIYCGGELLGDIKVSPFDQ